MPEKQRRSASTSEHRTSSVRRRPQPSVRARATGLLETRVLALSVLILLISGLALPAAGPVAAVPVTPVTGEVEAAVATSAYFGQGSSWDANEPARQMGVYGDSLVMQAKPMILNLAATRHSPVDVWEHPGAAPCDLFGTYGSRMTAKAITRVELAFVGNATTECMTSRTGGRPPGVLSATGRTRIAALYERDLSVLIGWNRARGVVTYLVVPPTMAQGTWHGQMTASLTSVYSRLAARDPSWVRLNVEPRDSLTPGGPYRTDVTVTGRRVRLRHADGTHLSAPVGTARYAEALLLPLWLER